MSTPPRDADRHRLQAEATRLTSIAYIPDGRRFVEGAQLLRNPNSIEMLHFESPWQSGPDPARVRELHRVLTRLDREDRDLLMAYYFEGRTQEEIAKRMGIVQPSVHHRLRVAAERARVQASLPDLTPEDVEALLVERGVKAEHAQAAGLYFSIRNQSHVALLMGRSQGWVRHALIKAMDRTALHPVGQALRLIFQEWPGTQKVTREVRSR